MQTWQELIDIEKAKPYLQKLSQRLDARKADGVIIYPPAENIFNAFKLTPFEKVRVVILGQDPYHGPYQANGLAFSVNENVALPPSLKNIFKELSADIQNYQVPMHGDLSRWAKQGVFLLNTVLTVEKGQAHSHADLGWEQFTDEVIETLNKQKENLVFLLWGSHAQKKGRYIDENKHLVLTSPHPSPLSAYRGFFGSKHFSKTNQYLIEKGYQPINW